MYNSPWHTIAKPMVYNTGPRVLQSHTVYNTHDGYVLQFELKSKVGRVKQEQAQQSTNAAVNIRQGIGHSSLKKKKKIK